MPEQTAVCKLTPPGRGAVATILVRGDLELVDQFFHARNGKAVTSQMINRIRFGEWRSPEAPPEEIVLCRTAANSLELHCHGGEAATQRILGDLTQRGAAPVSPWSILDSLNDAEFRDGGLATSTQATTERTALLVLEQVQHFPEAMKRFDSSPPAEQSAMLAQMWRWASFGTHLIKPWKLAICGCPNAGKSSLTNRLLGYERSVVFDQPGTTRDALSSLTAIDGWPIEIIDTAGQRETSESLEAEGIERAKQAAQSANLTLLVLDATLGLTPADQAIASQLHEHLIVWNKIDLLPHQNQPHSASNRSVNISARSGEGIPELMSAIIQRLVPEVPPTGTVYPVSEEHHAWLNRQDRPLK